ncbi:helix-turn-helix transcriptional regulator [Streptomyces griseoaurantiacus]|jgi:predicted ArsR family transcriptional regulator|uniref:helix-turn-helix transcriptional regulator n=1 Tax=Streptomyces griseoaurantiacus TaxID=68213 RepID=UPI00368637CB
MVAVVTHQEGAPLSPRRLAVLDAVRDAGAPVGIAEVAERLGVHPNTVRFHLDALVTQGRVERTVEQPSGPGRPRTVHTVRHGMDRGGARHYRLLARMLVSRLASTAPAAEAAAEATEAGRAWGRHLVERFPPGRRPTVRASVARLTAVLDELGFAPRADGETDGPAAIRLRHCPFLELAEEYRGVVCPLHLGLMQGALAELGAPVEATRLEPFAEPDTCVAHLAPT